MDRKITTTDVLPSLSHKYELVIEKDYGKVFLLADDKIAICELTKEYVPIEEFKEIFSETSAIIDEYQIRKFIFDKQNLQVFHQPSMEWYFLHWKKEMYSLGLKIHRKVLPKNNPAFTLAVEAGRSKIAKEYTDTVIPLLDIEYKESIREAIES